MELTKITFGDETPTVGLLQEVLSKTGYYGGGITYAYDNATASALEDFQKAAGLVPDGIVGPLTWGALMPYITGNYIYKVKSGDTLSTIAARFRTELNSIKAANPLLNSDNIVPGEEITVPFISKIIPVNLKYSNEIMQLNINALKLRYPFIEIIDAGMSVLGKNIPVIRIGRGTRKVFYNASHHANEWITTPLLMKFTDDFCYAFVNDQTIKGFNIRRIFDKTSIYIMPMVNPDGVDLVTGALPKDSEGYKYAVSISRENIPFPSGWKANIRGVDLNLNYPARWEEAKKIKYAKGYSSPAPRDFVGPYPFSEPESRTVGQFTKNINPDLTLSYHSQGEIIYWKFLDYNPPASLEIAQEFSRQSGYTVAETPYESGFAGYKDWFIQEYNLPGYTIEVGKGSSPLPLTQFDQIYTDNIGILLYAADTQL